MNTEKLLCSTLLEMMEERPFEQIKVTQLTEKSGVSRSTFYVYFDSIFAVLQKIEDDFMDSIVADKSARPDLSQAEVIASFTYLRDNIDTFRVLTGRNGDPAFSAKLAARNKRVLLSLASALGSNASEVELQIINEFTLAGKLQAFRWWAEHKNYVSVNDMLSIVSQLMSKVHELLRNDP